MTSHESCAIGVNNATEVSQICVFISLVIHSERQPALCTVPTYDQIMPVVVVEPAFNLNCLF